MKVYIVHNFVARDWLRNKVLPILRENGIESTATWITDDSHIDAKNGFDSACQDLADIDKADALIIFLDQHPNSVSSGKGKWFEFGYAYGKKPIYLIGLDKTCIFTHLFDTFYVDINEFVASIPKETYA